jgi:hypothetical protein
MKTIEKITASIIITLFVIILGTLAIHIFCDKEVLLSSVIVNIISYLPIIIASVLSNSHTRSWKFIISFCLLSGLWGTIIERTIFQKISTICRNVIIDNHTIYLILISSVILLGIWIGAVVLRHYYKIQCKK